MHWKAGGHQNVAEQRPTHASAAVWCGCWAAPVHQGCAACLTSWHASSALPPRGFDRQLSEIEPITPPRIFRAMRCGCQAVPAAHANPSPRRAVCHPPLPPPPPHSPARPRMVEMEQRQRKRRRRRRGKRQGRESLQCLLSSGAHAPWPCLRPGALACARYISTSVCMHACCWRVSARAHWPCLRPGALACATYFLGLVHACVLLACVRTRTLAALVPWHACVCSQMCHGAHTNVSCCACKAYSWTRACVPLEEPPKHRHLSFFRMRLWHSLCRAGAVGATPLHTCTAP